LRKIAIDSGGILALPEDYINRTFQHPLDREIVLLLYNLRDSKLSSREIQPLCITKHFFAEGERRYGLRHVEERLKNLATKGDISRREEIIPKKRGRRRYLFSISDNCKNEIESYVKTPKLKSAYRIGAIFEKENELDQHAGASGGIAHSSSKPSWHCDFCHSIVEDASCIKNGLVLCPSCEAAGHSIEEFRNKPFYQR